MDSASDGTFRRTDLQAVSTSDEQGDLPTMQSVVLLSVICLPVLCWGEGKSFCENSNNSIEIVHGELGQSQNLSCNISRSCDSGVWLFINTTTWLKKDGLESIYEWNVSNSYPKEVIVNVLHISNISVQSFGLYACLCQSKDRIDIYKEEVCYDLRPTCKMSLYVNSEEKVFTGSEKTSYFQTVSVNDNVTATCPGGFKKKTSCVSGIESYIARLGETKCYIRCRNNIEDTPKCRIIVTLKVSPMVTKPTTLFQNTGSSFETTLTPDETSESHVSSTTPNITLDASVPPGVSTITTDKGSRDITSFLYTTEGILTSSNAMSPTAKYLNTSEITSSSQHEGAITTYDVPSTYDSTVLTEEANPGTSQESSAMLHSSVPSKRYTISDTALSSNPMSSTTKYLNIPEITSSTSKHEVAITTYVVPSTELQHADSDSTVLTTEANPRTSQESSLMLHSSLPSQRYTISDTASAIKYMTIKKGTSMNSITVSDILTSEADGASDAVVYTESSKNTSITYISIIMVQAILLIVMVFVVLTLSCKLRKRSKRRSCVDGSRTNPIYEPARGICRYELVSLEDDEETTEKAARFQSNNHDFDARMNVETSCLKSFVDVTDEADDGGKASVECGDIELTNVKLQNEESKKWASNSTLATSSLSSFNLNNKNTFLYDFHVYEFLPDN